jgi:hypothetical protein
MKKELFAELLESVREGGVILRGVREPSESDRPNGPGERSPGLRPEADALGGEIANALRPERPRNRCPDV